MSQKTERNLEVFPKQFISQNDLPGRGFFHLVVRHYFEKNQVTVGKLSLTRIVLKSILENLLE